MSSRQKKLEKKKAKRTEKKKAATRIANLGIAEKLQKAASAPILDCALYSNDGPEPKDMTQLMFSRRLPSGEVAVAFWMIDMDLLGLKNGWGAVVGYGRYKEFRDDLQQRYEHHPITPADARKLVEDAVAYARKYEFEPHADARKALPLLGDIDAGQSLRQYTFGRDGKPLYISGPNESTLRSQQIVEQLKRIAGPGGFHYVIGVSDLDDQFETLGDDEPDGHIHDENCDHDHDHSHDHDHDHDCSRDHDHDH